MSIRSSLRELRAFLKRPHPVAWPQSAAWRLVLERLEDRTLLDVTTQGLPIWIGGLPSSGVIGGGQTQNIPGFAGSDRTRNPVIGAIQAIAPHPTNADILYIASVNGGIYKSTNARSDTASWTNLTWRYPSLSMGDLAMSPLDSNVLYAGTGRFSSGGGDGGPLNGLLKTTDGGNTWTMLGQATFGGQSIVRIVPTSLSNGQVVLVASNNGVWRSTDSGVSWTQISRSLPPPSPPGQPPCPSTITTSNTCLPFGAATDLVADPTNPNRFYAAIPSTPAGEPAGVFRSDDGGVTWFAATLPAGGNRIRLAVGAQGVVYAATMGSQLSNVFRSTNQGAAWTTMGVPSPTIHPGGQAGTHFSIVPHPTDPTVVFVGGDRQNGPFPNGNRCDGSTGNHFRGVIDAQGRTTWARSDCDGARAGGAPTSPHADSRAMAFDADGNLLEADDGGIYRLINPNGADDARRWRAVFGDFGIAPTEFYSVAFDSGSSVFFGGAQDVGSSEGADGGWHEVTVGDGGVVAIDTTSQPGRSIRYTTSQNLGCSTNPAGLCVGPGDFQRRTFDDHGRQLGDPETVALRVLGTGSPPNANLFQVENNTPGGSTVQSVQPYVLNNTGDRRRMIIGTNYLYESADEGETLNPLGGVQEVPPGSGNWVPTNQVGKVQGIAYGGFGNPDALWVGTTFPRMCNPMEMPPCFSPQLRLRTNAVGVPAVLPAYTAAGGSFVRAIKMDPQDWRTAYVLDNASRVWRTTDMGTTWTELTSNLCNLSTDLRTIEVVRRSISLLAVFVGGQGGVYRILGPETTGACAAGTTGGWSRFGVGGGNAVVTDLHWTGIAGQPVNDFLYAGRFGTGIGIVRREPGANDNWMMHESVLTVNAAANEVVRLARHPNIPGVLEVFENGERSWSWEANAVQRIVVNGLAGNVTVNIEDTFPGVPVTINLGGGGTHTINVSPTARTLNTIRGNITVNGGAGTNLLNVNDQNDQVVLPGASFTYTVTSTSLSRTSSALISYSSLSALTLGPLSFGTTAVWLQDLPANMPTTINLGNSVNSVEIGHFTRNLDGIRSNVVVNGAALGDRPRLDIFDNDNAPGRDFAIRPDRVSYAIVGVGTIDISYQLIGNLSLHVGAGDNDLTVFDTAPGTATTLVPDSGCNHVHEINGTLLHNGNGGCPGGFGPRFSQYTVEAPATLSFVGGTFDLNANSTITGAGTVLFSSSSIVTVAGTYNVSGPTRIASPSTVNFNSAATTGQLFLTGGVLGGTGDVTVTDMLTWTDGTMQGSGRTLVTGRLEISGAARKTLDTRRLENAGQAVWSDAGEILVSNGGIFTNSPTGVFDVHSDSRLRQGNGARGQFTNAGTLRKSAGSQATAIEVNFNNAGTVDVQTGTLSLLGDGSDSGAFTVAAGTTLGFDGGTHTLTAGSMVTTSGAIRFGTSTTTVNGSIAAATGSNVAFESGTHILGAGSSLGGTTTVRFASPTNVTFGGTYTVTGLTRSTGGQANFTSNGSTTQLALEGGFIGGSADLTVSGATTWIAAGYNGTGHLRANGGIVITGPAPKQVTNGTLDNAGLATWNDAGPLQIGQGGTWNNLAGSTLEAHNDASMQGFASQLGRFLNAGLFRKAQSTGTTQVSVGVTNSGTIHVQTGTVLLDGSLTNLSGTTLTGGTFQVQTTLQIPGADVRTNAAILILDGVSSIISRDNQRTDALDNLAVNTADGRLTIRNGRALTTGGGFDNAGLFTMEDTGILTLGGNWNNSGQFQWHGSGDVRSFVATRFDNRAGATFDIRGDAHFRNSGGFNSNFVNAGAVRKSAGTGSSNFDATGFNNNGTVEAQTGTLQLNNGGASTGSFSVSAGATLTFGSGTYLLGPSSSVSGEGQVLFTASIGFSSTSIVQGSYTVTGSTRVVAISNLSSTTVSFLSAAPITTGDLTLVGGPAYFGTDATATSLTLQQGGPTGPSNDLDGPGTVTVNGLITWTAGTMSGLGTTIALGGLVMSGPDQKWLVSRTLINAGTATWTGGSFLLNDGTLNNPAGAVFDIQTDGTIASTGSPGVINNAGTLRKSAGTGTTAITVFLNNSGAVEVQTGTLRLVQNSTSSGGITIQAGAGLEFAAGTFQLTDTAFIAGDGRVRFTNGRTSLTGSYNVGDTVIDAGTADFAADASTGTLTQSGGTLTGAGTLTVTGQTTWTGGTMNGIGRTIALGGLQISGADSKLLFTRALDNFGEAIWTGGTIVLDSDAPVVNYEGATFDIRTDAIFIQSGGGPAPMFTNLGTLRKSAGVGASEFSSVALNNSGAVEVQVGTFRLGGGGDSTGSFTVEAGASLEFTGGDHLLSETATLAGDGRVAITAGTVYLAGDFTLAGGEVLMVGRNSTFTVAGAFNQSGGSTILAGGSLAVGSGLFLLDGTLSGSGQILGDVFNSASIRVGDATTVGTLTITGNYTQTADGTLVVKLGGTGGGQFDRLVVSGTATLAGTLVVTLTAGYVPASGDTIRFFTAGLMSGTFDTIAGDGPQFDAMYDATGLTLRAP